MSKRTNLTKKIRFEIFKRDSFKCQYCGQEAPDVILEVDHIIPVSKGGENELMNLITSCFDCNRGKGKRKINDNDVLKKQKEQLKEINKRREQLILMMEWKKELNNLDDECIKYIDEFLSKYNRYLNDVGISNYKKMIKKYGYKNVYDALETSFNQYYDPKDESTIEKSLSFVERIIKCKNRQEKNPMEYKYYYIRGILRNRFNYLNENMLMSMLRKYVLNEEDYEIVEYFAKTSGNWTEFISWFENEYY